MTGRTIAHYEVLEKAGEGGMGVVYRARDTHLDRIVALKLLPPEKIADAERKRRFVKEARAASALNHPNIVHIYDIASAGGVDFIAMEYVPGRTLAQAIGHKGLRLNEALKYAVQIADALSRAHAAGIIHRDLKPSNIMVAEDGTVKLLDFGIAKLVEHSVGENEPTETARVDQTPLTEDATIVGTVAYMSPEQAEGRQLDARSDIFAFGSVLYEMICGHRAFTGGSRISTLSAILHQDPPPLAAAGLPRDLEKIILHCLRKDPNRRFQYAADVKVALEDVREESESSSGARAVAAATKPLRRRLLYLAAATVLLLAALGGAWVWWRSRPAPAMTVLTRVTSDSGLTLDPALSSDGRLIAYASDRGAGGNLDIWVQHLSGGEPNRLTRDPADEREPAFSPDGGRVAFRSEREGGGIYIVSALGGESRLIAPKGHDPRFSPDGAWIAYWSGDPGSLRASGYIVSSSGGEPRQIQSEFASVRFPLWSPDGSSILFSGAKQLNQRSLHDWWVAPAQGGDAIRTGAFRALISQKLNRTFIGWAPAAWTADNHVLLTSELGNSANLWRLAISPRSFQIQGPAERLTTGSAQEDHPSIASGRVAFASLQQTSGIWSLPVAANQGKATGMPQRLTSGAAPESRPSVSADGQTLIFLSNRSGNSDIWRKDLKTGVETALTVTPGNEGYPVLSPDGLRVAYTASVLPPRISSRPGFHPLFILSIRGGVPEKVCEDCFRPESWSPDGRRLIVQRRSAPGPGPDDLELFDLSSRQLSLIVKSENDISSGRISPDGQWLSFQERTSPLTRRLWIVRLRGMAEIPQPEWIPVTGGKTLDRESRWSPDGSLLYFTSTRDGFHCVWAQRLDHASKRPAGDPFAVQHFHQARLGIRESDTGLIGLSVARDKIVLALGETTGNIWLMEQR